MFKKLFGKGEEAPKTIEVKAPISGNYVKLADIPDPVFAQEMMGKGFGIDPAEGKLVAPIEGEVVNVFPTKHAIGLKAANGLELLLHIGLETVAMNGEGFTTKVKAGDKVSVGDELVEFDIELIKQKASSAISPVIITNSDVIKQIDIVDTAQLIKATSTVLKIEVN